jgi:hypothetical protein
MDQIIYKEKYLHNDLVDKINKFYKDIDDQLSGGPKIYDNDNSSSLMKEGAWDIPLRLEIPANPIHQVIDKLKNDFGDIFIHTSSIRHLGYPFTPHTDIRSSDWIIEHRKNFDSGYTFLIPLWWENDYRPGTAFFSSPPADGEPMYVERQHQLPQFKRKSVAKNFSIKKLVPWKHTGDLVCWKNYIYHCSMTDQDFVYSDDRHCKSFISIETFLKRN